MVSSRVVDPLATLRRTGRNLPERLRNAVLAMGKDAVPRLIELVESEDDSVRESWAPIHAARLLIELRATEAVVPLLNVLKSADSETVIANSITVHLSELGASVLEPALRLLNDPVEDDTRDAVYEILSNLGIRDERIYQLLTAHFENEPVLGAICLGNYRDERALPLLRTAIERFEPDWESSLGLLDLDEFLEAYEKIAGELPEDLENLAEDREAEWSDWQAARHEIEIEQRNAPVVSNKIGRNELCPCGSGRKYKHCCATSPDRVLR